MKAMIRTNKGDINLELLINETPMTVFNFVALARGDVTGKPFYDGLKFHRVIQNFMIQGGCPFGTGSGGPGYKFKDEITNRTFNRPGILAMANSGKDSNGSQIFITHVPTPHLNGKHTIFGCVQRPEDQAVVNLITQGDIIESVQVSDIPDNFKEGYGTFVNELKTMLATRNTIE